MRFDITDLRLFAAIVDAGSITHGAAASNLSLAAASERLRDMEKDAGVRLLDRGRRGITPTCAGEALAHHARLILCQMARMRSELSDHAPGTRATVRLLANTSAITQFLPDPLGIWLAAHPQVDIELKERQSNEIVKAVSGGLADLGIISDAADSGDLKLRPFAVDRLVAVVARSHPLARIKQASLADIVGLDHVGLADGALQKHVEDQARQIGRTLNVRVRVRTFMGLCQLVAHGVGVGVVPERAAQRCRRTMPFAILPLTDGWAMRRLSLCHAADHDLPRSARALFDHLSTNAR